MCIAEHVQRFAVPELVVGSLKPLPESVVLERSGSFSVARRMGYKTGRERDHVFFLRQPLDISGTFILGDDFQIKDLKY